MLLLDPVVLEWIDYTGVLVGRGSEASRVPVFNIFSDQGLHVGCGASCYLCGLATSSIQSSSQAIGLNPDIHSPPFQRPQGKIPIIEFSLK